MFVEKKWLWIGGGVAVAALLLSRKAKAVTSSNPLVPEAKAIVASGPVSKDVESAAPNVALLPKGGGAPPAPMSTSSGPAPVQSPPVGNAAQAVPASIQQTATNAAINAELPKTSVAAPNALPQIVSARSLVPVPMLKLPVMRTARMPAPILRIGTRTTERTVTLPKR